MIDCKSGGCGQIMVLGRHTAGAGRDQAGCCSQSRHNTKIAKFVQEASKGIRHLKVSPALNFGNTTYLEAYALKKAALEPLAFTMVREMHC